MSADERVRERNELGARCSNRALAATFTHNHSPADQETPEGPGRADSVKAWPGPGTRTRLRALRFESLAALPVSSEPGRD
eukprot:1840105-Rhodomonas_salina.1